MIFFHEFRQTLRVGQSHPSVTHRIQRINDSQSFHTTKVQHFFYPTKKYFPNRSQSFPTTLHNNCNILKIKIKTTRNIVSPMLVGSNSHYLLRNHCATIAQLAQLSRKFINNTAARSPFLF